MDAPGRRVFVRGLPADISPADLASRFSAFGQVSNASVALSALDSTCRGFGHLDLRCEDAGWRRCLTALNGSSWKGQRVQIEEARPDYRQRLEASPGAAAKVSRHARPRRRLTRHAADMTLVTGKNVDKRKGWRRGMSGVPVAIVNLRKPDGTMAVFDPSHDVEAIKKFNEAYRPRPLHTLTQPAGVASGAAPGAAPEEPSEWPAPSDAEAGAELSGPAVPVPVSVLMPVPVPMPEPSHPQDAAGAVAPGGKKTWDDVAGGQGFSLALALNLPSAPVAPLPASQPARLADSTPSRPAAAFDLSRLFYSFADLFASPLSPEQLFCCRGSRLESVSVWRAGRSEIRKDFKKQAKAAKRQVRKKQSLGKK